MAYKIYKGVTYFQDHPEIVKVFEDLEAYHDFCRFELRDFNPAELYKKDSPNYSAYLASKKSKRPYQGSRSKAKSE